LDPATIVLRTTDSNTIAFRAINNEVRTNGHNTMYPATMDLTAKDSATMESATIDPSTMESATMDFAKLDFTTMDS
jgi:hypothetical protein